MYVVGLTPPGGTPMQLTFNGVARLYYALLQASYYKMNLRLKASWPYHSFLLLHGMRQLNFVVDGS